MFWTKLNISLIDIGKHSLYDKTNKAVELLYYSVGGKIKKSVKRKQKKPFALIEH